MECDTPTAMNIMLHYFNIIHVYNSSYFLDYHVCRVPIVRKAVWTIKWNLFPGVSVAIGKFVSY